MYFYEIVLDSVFYVKWIVPVDYDRGVLASVHSTSESNDWTAGQPKQIYSKIKKKI